MNANELHSQVLPSLLGGTSRHPLPGDPLAMLSLMGQALRFEHPPKPESFVIEPEIKDDRSILAGRLRRPLVRVLTAKNTTDHPARALARAFERLRLRPHPFDLPLMDAFVRSYAEKLGPTAQHWADKQKPDTARQSYFDPESLDETNWAHAALSRRVAYLERRREEDPDAARALLESTWAQEDADTRFRILQTLQIRLGAADQSFLNLLEKDRAPRVRTLAARFLARLGASSRNPALDACMERMKRGHSGVLRNRATLQLEIPANVKDQAVSRWILQAFTEVSFGELAGALHMSETDLIEAAADDQHLLLALALMASGEPRLDLLELVVAKLPNAWERMFEAGLDTLGAMTESERLRWQEIVAHPYIKDPPAAYPLWDWLHRIADREAPPSVMSAVLRTGLLAKVPENELTPAPMMEVMAAICPASQRQQLRGQLAGLDPSQTVAALTLLEILDGMENAHTHV